MIKKLTSSLGLLKAGQRVANPEAWKTGQMTASAVSAFIVAGLATYYAFTGTEITIGEEELSTIATALIAVVPPIGLLVNSIITVITTNKIGIKKDL